MPGLLGTDARDSGKLHICRVTVKAKQPLTDENQGPQGHCYFAGRDCTYPCQQILAVNCHGITRGSGYLQLPEIVNPESGVTFSDSRRGERLGLPQVSQLPLEGSSARQRAQQAETGGTSRTHMSGLYHKVYCLPGQVTLSLEGRSVNLSNSAAYSV